jgi:CelD/BcsL family acetyltransferase involved in cellulose biosynthesis
MSGECPEVRILTQGEALRFVVDRAGVLDDTANPPNPFAGSAWVRHFIDQVVPADGQVLAVDSRESGDSLMLLSREAGKPGQCRALANYYASLYSPLRSTSSDRTGGIAHIVRLLGEMRPRISTLNLAPLDAEAADTIALSDTLSRHGWYVRRYFCFGNWYLPCDGLAFDAYMGERDSQLRNTWVRKSKRLLAAGRVRIVDSTAEVESAMDAYDAVYAKSWKQPEPYVDFVRGWARICARNGWLRLGIASVDETPIAAQFWFTVGRRAYIFKLAYDDGQAKWSAGTVLTAHMIRHALEVDRVVEIDYLTGDDAYKKSWMTQRRERVGLMACNTRTVRGLAAAGRELAGELRARVRARAQPEAQRAAATRDTRRPSPESSST